MKNLFLLLGLGLLTSYSSPEKELIAKDDPEFPSQLVHFTPYKVNPVFSGTGTATWDENIRERGYILKEGNTYHLWYTGYGKGKNQPKFLGYATSADGLHWTRYAGNPIYTANWVEDMSVSNRTESITCLPKDKTILRICWSPLIVSTGRNEARSIFATKTVLRSVKVLTEPLRSGKKTTSGIFFTNEKMKPSGWPLPTI